MKVFVLGGTGMLGSTVFRHLNKNANLDVYCTTRSTCYSNQWRVFDFKRDALHNIIGIADADYIVNCIGVIKPDIDESSPQSVASAVMINGAFPHELGRFAGEIGAKVIHASTDCVFSGDRLKSYRESDIPDAQDLYGKSKAVGESRVNLNIRTSIVGHEEAPGKSLLEWFLRSAGKTVNGYTNHFWNGITTLRWAKVVEQIITEDKWVPGIRHLWSDVVSKCELLEIFRRVYEGIGVGVPRVFPTNAPIGKWMVLDTEHPLFIDALRITPIEHQVEEMARDYDNRNGNRH